MPEFEKAKKKLAKAKEEEEEESALFAKTVDYLVFNTCTDLPMKYSSLLSSSIFFLLAARYGRCWLYFGIEPKVN